MGRRPASRWVRRRSLSDDVRRRNAIGVAKSAAGGPLPWLQPRVVQSEGEDMEARTPDEIAVRRAPQGREQSQEQGPGDAGTRLSPEQVADRVYELICQDLHVERERIGWDGG